MDLRKSFLERDQFTLGIFCTLVVLLILTATLRIGSLPFLAGGRYMTADFSEAGGLQAGDDVQVAGLAIGKVVSVKLDGTHVAVRFRVTNDHVRLGSETSARIATVDILGKKTLALDPSGTGDLQDKAVITRTTSPYDITQALEGLTSKVQDLDVGSLSEAMRSISTAVGGTSPQLDQALTSLTQVANTIGARDVAIRGVLSSAKDVAGVLASRNSQVTALLSNGSSLLQELQQRRVVITTLLQNATAVAQQLQGLAAEQQDRFGPMLSDLQKTIALLTKNKANIQESIKKLGQYASELGEAVGSGPAYNAYVPNLTDPTSLPFFPTFVNDLLGGAT